MSYNIIGDIAGQFKTLQALLSKMPAGIPISVGDMCDRGPQSREVLEFFLQNGKAVMGNHEDMLLSFLTGREGRDGIYPYGCYCRNGGEPTLRQFMDESESHIDIPLQLLDWITNLPTEMRLNVPSDDGLWEGCIITHAPIHKNAEAKDQLERGVLWNRDWLSISEIKGFFQLNGHNAHWRGQAYTNNIGDMFGMCLDTSETKLIGMHWPSMELFEQEFIHE